MSPIRQPFTYGFNIHHRATKLLHDECIIDCLRFEVQTISGYLKPKPGLLNWILSKTTAPDDFTVTLEFGASGPVGPVETSLLLTPHAPFKVMPPFVLKRMEKIQMTLKPHYDGRRAWLRWLAPFYEGQVCFMGHKTFYPVNS